MALGSGVRREIDVLRERNGSAGGGPAARIPAERFKTVLGAVASPVSVVTATEDDRPHGTTVSAFCELSLEPPLMLVSLDRGSELLQIVCATRRFAINVLAHGQHELALRFARKGRDSFEGIAWREELGLPRLEGAQGWMACEVLEEIEGGDHLIVIGTVLDGSAAPAEPLLYRHSRFGTILHREHDEVGLDGDAAPGSCDVWPIDE